TRSRPRGTQLRRRWSGSALGRRHHVHPDLGGLSLPRRRPRCLEPPGRGLGDGDASPHRARARRAQQAVTQRRPAAVIHASGQGWNTRAWGSGRAAARGACGRPWGWVGAASDNALGESFFATLGCELLDRPRFKTQVAPRLAVFEFIEGWYNPHRRHSALDYL